jgi:hypothetical protein
VILPFPCQRWRDRRGSYRPHGEPIDPSRYGVELLDRDRAKGFVVQHHYEGTYPAAIVNVGLFHMHELVGVAVFSQPMTQRTVPKWTGLEPAEGIELGRFVLRDDVPANGETWFLARAFKVLKAEHAARAVVSFSDPMARTAADGRVTMPGHIGTIYQASNARYVGRAKPKVIHLGPDGKALSARSLAKIRNEERGADGAVAALVRAGAPAPRLGEDGAAYVERVLSPEGPFRRVRHPGTHCYVFALDKRAASSFQPALAYPKAA